MLGSGGVVMYVEIAQVTVIWTPDDAISVRGGGLRSRDFGFSTTTTVTASSARGRSDGWIGSYFSNPRLFCCAARVREVQGISGILQLQLHLVETPLEVVFSAMALIQLLLTALELSPQLGFRLAANLLPSSCACFVLLHLAESTAEEFVDEFQFANPGFEGGIGGNELLMCLRDVKVSVTIQGGARAVVRPRDIEALQSSLKLRIVHALEDWEARVV